MVFAVSSIVSLLEIVLHPNEQADIGMLSATIPMIIMVVISIFLWIFADKISDRLVGEVQYVRIAQDIDYDKVQFIAFCIAGILLMGKAMPDLFSSLYQIIIMANSQISNGNRIYNGYLAKIIGSGIQCIIGLWLVLGTGGIINIIKKLRTAGVN
jgi:hypothetical protein